MPARMPDDVMDRYLQRLRDTVEPMLPIRDNQEGIARLTYAVEMARREFLFDHNDAVRFEVEGEFYVSMGPVEFDIEAGQIIASICSVSEQARMEREREERDRMLQELEARQLASEQQARKQYANMLRQRRRLMQRCSELIPPGTKSIWHSLTDAQQYSILKDIDYQRRHKDG